CTEWASDFDPEKVGMPSIMSFVSPPHPVPDGRHPLPQGERVRPRNGHALPPSPPPYPLADMAALYGKLARASLPGEGPGVRGESNTPAPWNWTRAQTVQHTFTHFHLELRVFAALRTQVENEGEPFGGEWAALSGLSQHALPSVMKKAVASGLEALGLPMLK